MPTIVLRPTAHAVVEPNVDDPAQAYDGSVATAARLHQDTVGSHATLHLTGLPADPAPYGRQQIVVTVLGHWDVGGQGDFATLYARRQPGDPWILVGTHQAPQGWPQGAPAASVQFDVTALLGASSATSWGFLVDFYNGPPGGPSPPPTPTLPA